MSLFDSKIYFENLLILKSLTFYMRNFTPKENGPSCMFTYLLCPYVADMVSFLYKTVLLFHACMRCVYMDTEGNISNNVSRSTGYFSIKTEKS
jgi:hypothetical protein